MAARADHGGNPGIGVDYRGREVVDPTKNVLDLVRAESLRQDGLREAETRRINELAEMRERYEAVIETMRNNSLRLLADQLRENKADASERISKLEQFRYESSGGGSGRRELWGYIIGAATLGASLAVIVTFAIRTTGP